MRKPKTEALLAFITILISFLLLFNIILQWQESKCYSELNNQIIEKVDLKLSRTFYESRMMEFVTLDYIIRANGSNINLSFPNSNTFQLSNFTNDLVVGMVDDQRERDDNITILEKTIRDKKFNCSKYSFILKLIILVVFVLYLLSIYLVYKVIRKSK